MGFNSGFKGLIYINFVKHLHFFFSIPHPSFVFNLIFTSHNFYHAIVKSTITYAAETLCIRAKTVAKLNSTEMDFCATLSSNFQEGQN